MGNNNKKSTVNRVSREKKSANHVARKKYKGPSFLFFWVTNLSIVFLLKHDIAKHMMTLNPSSDRSV